MDFTNEININLILSTPYRKTFKERDVAMVLFTAQIFTKMKLNHSLTSLQIPLILFQDDYITVNPLTPTVAI